MKEYGKKTWLIADCFYPAVSTVAKSHEAICVLNTGLKEAQITLTLYFEDAPKRVFRTVCPGERTHHIRMDKLVDENGEGGKALCRAGGEQLPHCGAVFPPGHLGRQRGPLHHHGLPRGVTQSYFFESERQPFSLKALGA